MIHKASKCHCNKFFKDVSSYFLFIVIFVQFTYMYVYIHIYIYIYKANANFRYVILNIWEKAHNLLRKMKYFMFSIC